MPTTKCLTISEVCQLRDGDWINDGVIAVVSTIETKQAGQRAKNPGKKFWVVALNAEDGPENVELSLFFAPKFREGDLIELTGRGIKYTQNNYGSKLSIGQETEITVVSKGSSQDRLEANQDEPRRSAPRGDARGGGQEQGEHESEAAPVNAHFHPKMSATALFYLHCLSYARKINTTLKATGHPEMSPDHFQACVSTLFIAGDRNGLAIAPPPSSKISPTPTEEPKKAPPARREPDPLADEDVPF